MLEELSLLIEADDLQGFLTEVTDYTVTDANNLTLLHISAKQGASNITLALIDKIDVNVQDKYGYTPLYYAARQGHLAVATLLLDNGANIHMKTFQFEKTVLHEAACSGHIALMRLFIECGANIQERDKYNSTILHEAAASGQEDVVQFLLVNDALADINSQDEFGYTPLQQAARRVGNEVPNAKGNIIRKLVKSGADTEIKNHPAQGSNSALHIAAACDHQLATKALIACNANLNTQNKAYKTPIQEAALNGNLNLMKILLNAGALLSDVSAIMFALIEKNQLEVIQYLLEHGYNVHQRDHIYHETPLLTAAAYLRPKLVSLFLDYGASINDKNDSGYTALHLLHHYRARRPYSQQASIVRILLEQGINLFATDKNGVNAFMTFYNAHTNRHILPTKYQEARNHIEILELFIEYGYFEQAFLKDYINTRKTKRGYYISVHHFPKQHREQEAELFKQLTRHAAIANKLYHGKGTILAASMWSIETVISIVLNLVLTRGLQTNDASLKGFIGTIAKTYKSTLSVDTSNCLNTIDINTRNFERDLINIILQGRQSFAFNFFNNKIAIYRHRIDKFYDNYPEFTTPGNLIARLLTKKELFISLILCYSSLAEYLKPELIKYMLHKQALIVIREASWLVKNQYIDKVNAGISPATREELASHSVADQLLDLYDQLVLKIKQAASVATFDFSVKTQLQQLLTHNGEVYLKKTSGICWPI